MIVVDTNIISYRLIKGDKTDKAIDLEQYDPEWIVPVLWRFEFLNVLSTLTKNDYLNLNQSLIIWKNAESILKNREYHVHPEKTLEFSIKHRISAYDAQYIVLAEANDIKCITEDKQLLKLFPSLTLSLSTVHS